MMMFAWCTTGAAWGRRVEYGAQSDQNGYARVCVFPRNLVLVSWYSAVRYGTSCVVHSDSHKRRLRRRGFGSVRRKHVEE